MSRAIWLRAIAVFSFITLLTFQNCGKLGAPGGQESQSSHSSPHIMRISSVEEPNVDIVFRVHDESISGSAQFAWSYTLNSALTGCTPKTAANATSYTINCTQAGGLKVSVTVTDDGQARTLVYQTLLKQPITTDEIPLDVVFEIPNGTNNSSWNSAATRVEVFVGQTLKLKNLDSTPHQLHTGGRPCPHGNSIAPGATVDCVVSQTYDRTANGRIYDHNDGTTAEFFAVAYSGATLYAQNCASCHGSLASSTKQGRKVSQILAARSTQPQMQTAALAGLTRRQIEAISFALGGR